MKWEQRSQHLCQSNIVQCCVFVLFLFTCQSLAHSVGLLPHCLSDLERETEIKRERERAGGSVWPEMGAWPLAALDNLTFGRSLTSVGIET